MSLDHLWAGWRMAYVASAGAGDDQPSVLGPLDGDECVFCAILAADATDDEKLLVFQGKGVIAMLNAFPYASGHLMVMPRRHLRELRELGDDEAAELWRTVHEAVAALGASYEPDGCNLGVNLGRAAGAGIPGHLHVHVVPRWVGDTNFMTSTASTRVLPEALSESLAAEKGLVGMLPRRGSGGLGDFLDEAPTYTPIPPRRQRPPKPWGALVVERDEVVATLSSWRALLAMRRRLAVPLSSVLRVEHDPAARAHVQAKLRKSGGLSGVFRVGTYHSLQGWSFWSIGLGRNAVLLETSGRFRFVVIEVADPGATVAAIARAASFHEHEEPPGDGGPREGVL